jgi:hypothetical protein
MLNNLWRIVGFGEPETITHFAGRAMMCFLLAIVLIAIGEGTTVFDGIMIMILGLGVGMYVMIIKSRLEKIMDERNAESSTQNSVEEELLLDPERDYVINPGHDCWITVGNYSLRVAQKDNGRAEVKLFHIYREDEEPIAEIVGE